MKDSLFPFQRRAVAELRKLTAMALRNYRDAQIPQVISLQAPTGAGKTIIMAAFVEEVYFGSDQFVEQPEAIFVWLSDSPSLNAQSREKFQLRSSKLRFGQCVTIEDTSFDMEMLEDGQIYFLNTQKLGKAGNLSKHGDRRQYTIWETLENTAKKKSDRLYFIIDEAHRGMQGTEAGKATSIMQRFLKGSRSLGLSPMPVVIGVSATADRFNQLVGNTTSTLNKHVISPNEVRGSGLLKDRIIITHPENPEKHDDMAILQAATDEWIAKCAHWNQYCYEQHYAQVNPVFVVQVLAGSGKDPSATNLEDVVAKIEERLGRAFHEYEIVHTFGSTPTLNLNNLPVHYIEPSDIAADKRIQVVLFKENLSTGWDCPRAETMMSFRHAEDATYIAQLLGRMIRTPMQSHIQVDDYLNDVRLFLPYFNKSTVQAVIDELQNAEGGELPTVIDEDMIERPSFASWSIYPPRRKDDTPVPGQVELTGFDRLPPLENGGTSPTGQAAGDGLKQSEPQQNPTPLYSVPQKPAQAEQDAPDIRADQIVIPGVEIDRVKITKFINSMGLLTYMVRSVKVNSYLKSLLSLASLLTQSGIFPGAAKEMRNDVTDMIRSYIEELRGMGRYEELSAQVLSLKLTSQIFDPFGEFLDNGKTYDIFSTSETDLDRQLRIADAKLGGYGFPNIYGKSFYDENDPSAFKIDCILFAADEDCMERLSKYSEREFHRLNDQYRKYIVGKSEQWKKQYSDIIADGDAVSEHNFSLPENIYVRPDEEGREYTDHLFVDDTTGTAKIKLNKWESGLLEEESKRSNFACWLRNTSKAKWALCIPYEIDGETKAMYPDFLIVRYDAQLEYIIDILEPHSDSYKDNLGKAKGLARYAEAEPRIGRVQLIRQKSVAGKSRFIRLDLSHGAVRKKVLKAINTDELDHIFETDGFFTQ